MPYSIFKYLNVEMNGWGEVNQEFIRKTKPTHHSDCKYNFALVLKKKTKERRSHNGNQSWVFWGEGQNALRFYDYKIV